MFPKNLPHTFVKFFTREESDPNYYFVNLDTLLRDLLFLHKRTLTLSAGHAHFLVFYINVTQAVTATHE